MENLREFVLIGSTDTTDFLDNTAVNGTEYCYYVVASNVVGESGNSNTECATPDGPAPMYPPENLIADGEIGYISLEWTAPQVDGGGGDGGGREPPVTTPWR